MARLQHAPHEYFARLVAAGKPRYKAYEQAVARKASARNLRALASDLWRGKGLTSRNIQRRVSELQMERRKSAELTAERLIDDILLDSDLATAAGQHSAAIAGRKLIGSELFSMFRDRKEILSLDIKVNSKAELKQLLAAELGKDLADQVWEQWSAKPNRLIEHNPTDTDTETLDQVD